MEVYVSNNAPSVTSSTVLEIHRARVASKCLYFFVVLLDAKKVMTIFPIFYILRNRAKKK